MKQKIGVKTHYEIECIGADGKLKWKEEFDNLVVTAGLDKLLDATFKTGLTTPAWYVFLKNSGTPVAGDTMASHGSWTENQTFSNATRPAFTPGTISGGSVSNTSSKASFNINGSTTIYGAGLVDNNVLSPGTAGTLYGVGDFASSKSVISGDTLNVTATLTATAV